MSEGRIPVGRASLHYRVVGWGSPLIVLHGGPDFDHSYFLPDLDRLGDRFRLVYYDQRGRGRSAEHVRPEDVSLASDVEDVDLVRRHFELEHAAVLGHSWGALLALGYALRYPVRVSHLILMNPAPVSPHDLAIFREAYDEKLGAEGERQDAILSSEAYRQGDPEIVTARYRIHFKPALARAADHERLMANMRAAFVSQGAHGILKARAIEDRLLADTWGQEGYDLLPRLGGLRIPTVVVGGDHDFVPIEVCEHIAQAIPGARVAALRNCGHFAYLESPAEVRAVLEELLRATRGHETGG